MALTRRCCLLQKRISRDACAPKYTLFYDDVSKAASSLTISSTTGDCDAPVMIASQAVTGANPNPRVRRTCNCCRLPPSSCNAHQAVDLGLSQLFIKLPSSVSHSY